MRWYLMAGVSGWLGAILLTAVAVLPYLLRRSWLSARLKLYSAASKPYRLRMWPHYWLAYAACGISFGHGWVLMSHGKMGRTSLLGLYLASLASCWLLVQIVTGRTLQQGQIEGRRLVQRWHFWSMAAILALVAAHVWLNG